MLIQSIYRNWNSKRTRVYAEIRKHWIFRLRSSSMSETFTEIVFIPVIGKGIGGGAD